MPPDPPKGIGLAVELNLGLEKSGNFMFLESGNPARMALEQKGYHMQVFEYGGCKLWIICLSPAFESASHYFHFYLHLKDGKLVYCLNF